MTNPVRSALLAAVVALAPALSGCGGSGGSSETSPVTSQPGGSQPPQPTLGELAAGLTNRLFAGVTASDAEAHKLSRLLPNAQNAFAPLSVVLDRDHAGSRVTLNNRSHIKSISSDGEDGFRVTYVVDGVERQVQFSGDDRGATIEGRGTSGAVYSKQPDGTRRLHTLSSRTGAFNQAPRNDGSQEFRYFEIIGWDIVDFEELPSTDITAVQRGRSVYGARTETMPTAGSATYHGRTWTTAWRSNSPTLNSRLDMRGGLLLTADFGESAVEGRLHALQRNDASDSASGWETVHGHIAISNGVIADGQFTADLAGVAGSGASPGQSTTRGIEGGLLGEFYGPAAEEVGGVLSASQGDLVYQGFIGGRQVADRRIATLLPGADNPFTPLNVSVDRDFTEGAESVGLTTETYVKSISGDDAGGFRVTYVVAGAEKEVRFTEADFQIADNNYLKEVDDTRYQIWSTTGAFYNAPRNDGSPSGYAYFDANGWWTDPTGPEAHDGHSVYGVRTETLPGGTASYAGRAYARSYLADMPSRDDRSYIRGDLGLTANFGNGTIEGTIDRLERRNQGVANYSSMSGRVNVSNGRIASDSGFTATLAGVDTTSAALASSARGLTGEMRGAFFGPGAEEAGGVFSATRDADDTVMHGWFGGRKQ